MSRDHHPRPQVELRQDGIDLLRGDPLRTFQRGDPFIRLTRRKLRLDIRRASGQHQTGETRRPQFTASDHLRLN